MDRFPHENENPVSSNEMNRGHSTLLTGLPVSVIRELNNGKMGFLSVEDAGLSELSRELYKQ